MFKNVSAMVYFAGGFRLARLGPVPASTPGLPGSFWGEAMTDDDKPSRRKAAKFRKALEEVSEGKDIVAVAQAIGAQEIISFDEAIKNHAVARIFALPKRPRGRPTKYDPSWMCDAVIEVGRLGGSKDKMAATIGIHVDTIYEWVEKYPDFSDAIKEATQLSKVWWENCGQVSAIGMVEGFNSTTWIFNMKNRFPETYRDVKVTELNNTGAPLIDARAITINARELDDEARESLKMALLAARKLAGDNIDE